MFVESGVYPLYTLCGRGLDNDENLIDIELEENEDDDEDEDEKDYSHIHYYKYCSTEFLIKIKSKMMLNYMSSAEQQQKTKRASALSFGRFFHTVEKSLIMLTYPQTLWRMIGFQFTAMPLSTDDLATSMPFLVDNFFLLMMCQYNWFTNRCCYNRFFRKC